MRKCVVKRPTKVVFELTSELEEDDFFINWLGREMRVEIMVHVHGDLSIYLMK